MAINHHVEFLKHKILYADEVGRIEAHHHNKFSQSWSIQSKDIAIFPYSKWSLPPSWIIEIAKFYWQMGSRGSRCISMPNIIKICQIVAKILRFFNVSRWQPPPSWIVEFAKFYWLTVSAQHRCIAVPISAKLAIPLLRYCNFSIFQNACHCHLGFLKSRNCIGS